MIGAIQKLNNIINKHYEKNKREAGIAEIEYLVSEEVQRQELDAERRRQANLDKIKVTFSKGKNRKRQREQELQKLIQQIKCAPDHILFREARKPHPPEFLLYVTEFFARGDTALGCFSTEMDFEKTTNSFPDFCKTHSYLSQVQARRNRLVADMILPEQDGDSLEQLTFGNILDLEFYK